MTFEEVNTFFQTLANRLFSGDIKDLSDVHVYPFSVFVMGEFRIELSPSDSRRNVLKRREDFKRRRARLMSSKLLKIEPKSDGRFTVLLKLRLIGEGGKLLGDGLTRYLCRIDPPDVLRIEGCEIIRRTTPLVRHTTMLH